MNRFNNKGDAHYLEYSLTQLNEYCRNLIKENDAFKNVLKSSGDNLDINHDEIDDENNSDYNNTLEKIKLDDKIKKLKSININLEDGLEELELIKNVKYYANFLETYIERTKLRLSRLEEEYDWLKDELNYLRKKRTDESKTIEKLKQLINQQLFIYYERKKLNEEPNILPFFESTNESLKLNEIFPKIQLESSNLLKIHKDIFSSSKDYNDNDDNVDEYDDGDDDNNYGSGFNTDSFSSTDDVEVLNKNTSKVFNNMNENNHNKNKNDEIKQNSSKFSGKFVQNSANSTNLTLSELKELLIGDSIRDSKRQTETTASSQKVKSSLAKEKLSKSSKITINMTDDYHLNEKDRETLKQCLKSIIYTVKPKTNAPNEESLTVEELIDKFIRSNQRSYMMNSFLELVSQFNRRETRSPGIALCWIAINSLKVYEKELQQSKRICTKHGYSQLPKPGKLFPELIKSCNLPEESDYLDLTNDLCRFLLILSSLYRSRNDLPRAGECLREFLKIRRKSKTWKQPSVANALGILSLLRASLKDYISATSYAKKALQLRRELLVSDQTVVNENSAELAIARQATNLALILLKKYHSDQKRLRYKRFPAQDLSEIPSLLNESIEIETKLQQKVFNGIVSFNKTDWLNQITYVNDEMIYVKNNDENNKISNEINLIDESLICTRNSLAIFYICTKKWTKALKQLITNLAHIDHISSSDSINKQYSSHEQELKFSKITCLKCLLHVYRMTGQNEKQNGISDRLCKLDPYYQINDEIIEEDIIRTCQQGLFNNDFD